MSSLLEKFFDEQTMSVHIKPGMPVMAKKGVPGKWQLVPARAKVVTEAEAKKMIDELMSETTKNKGSFFGNRQKIQQSFAAPTLPRGGRYSSSGQYVRDHGCASP